MGSRAIGACSHRGGIRISRCGHRVRPAVGGRAGGEGLFPRRRSDAAIAARRGHGRDVAATGHVRRTASAHRQGRWLRHGVGACESRDPPRHGREAQVVARARHCGHSKCWSAAIRPRTSRSQRNWRSRRGPCPPACRPNCWNVVRTSSPPTGVSRLPSMASRKPRRPAAPHLADGIGQRHLQRAVRAQEQRQPGLERGRKSAAAGLQCGRAADAGPHPHGGAEAGDCRVWPDRRACIRGSRRRVVGRVCSGPARGRAGPRGRREPDRAGVCAAAVQGRLRRHARRFAAATRAVRGEFRRCCECSPSGWSSASTCTWPLGVDSTPHR